MTPMFGTPIAVTQHHLNLTGQNVLTERPGASPVLQGGVSLV